MIKDFRGQVKISDIQAAFDEIVGRINTLVDAYNQAAGYQDIDYTKGAPKLAAPNYTLTIGGLKTILNGYNNTLVGCNVFKIDDVSCILTDGLLITSNRVYRIPSQIVSGESDWDMRDLWLDVDNDRVTFKQGTHGVIVTEESAFAQPSISSNTDYGLFDATYNSQDAYKITTLEGWRLQTGIVGTFAYPQVDWIFPKSIKLNNISFDADYFNYTSGDVVVKCDDEEVYRGGIGHIDISLNNRQTSRITIYSIIPNNSFLIDLKYSNLQVQGISETMAISQGGVITPSPNLVKICDLNWRAKDGLIKDVKQLQIEKPVGYRLKNSNKSVYNKNAGYSNEDGLNTSDSGKFVSYSAIRAAGNSAWWGQVNVLGENIIYNREYGDSNKRSSRSSSPTSLFYIPRGCNDDMTSNGGGRTVTNPKFEYDE